MTRAQMIARMEAMLASADAQSRSLTADEQHEFDGLKAKVDALDTAAAQADDLAARRAEVQARRTASNSAPATRQIPIRGAEAKTEFENLGEFMFAACLNPSDARLESLWIEPNSNGRIRAEQRMDSGQYGGFMVPEQFRSDIFRVPTQEAFIRPRATVIPAGTPPDAAITLPYLNQSASGNVFGGMEIGWVEGEGGAKPDTDGKLGVQRLEPHEWAGVITFTDKLLRNWPASSAFFTTELRRSAAAFEDYYFLRGTGAAQPSGILNAASTGIVARQTNNDFTFNDYAEMVSRLLPGGSPVWSISLGMRSKVIKMRNPTGDGGDGSLIWAPSTVPGQPETLGGYPIFWNTRAPAVGSKGDVGLFDLSYYLIKDGSGPFVASDGGVVNFVNNKTLIKVFGNVDGGPRLKELFTTEGGYQVSPFVVLSANGGASNFTA